MTCKTRHFYFLFAYLIGNSNNSAFLCSFKVLNVCGTSVWNYGTFVRHLWYGLCMMDIKFGQFQAHQYLRFVVCIKFGHEIIISVRLFPIPKYFEKKIIENPWNSITNWTQKGRCFKILWDTTSCWIEWIHWRHLLAMPLRPHAKTKAAQKDKRIFPFWPITFDFRETDFCQLFSHNNPILCISHKSCTST